MWEILNKRIWIVSIAALGLLKAACTTDLSIASREAPEIQLPYPIDVLSAGDPVRLVFSGKTSAEAYLQLDNSYGTVLLTPDTAQKDNLEFSFPESFIQVAGICSWKLMVGNLVILKGDISISPKAVSLNHIESYLGPKDLVAGSSDRPMVVSIPTDTFDNPLSNGTEIVIEERYKGESLSFVDSVENLIHWRRIQPRTTSGRIFVSSTIGNSPSVEMYTDVSPGMASDFEINFKRNHEYADGNQVLLLETSVIKDAYENTVSDGTQVTFQIENSKTGSLFTNATTVNGVATAKMVHPDEASKWKIAAFIPGAAASNTLETEFKSAVLGFEASYDDKAHIVSIGPVNGFMGQLVPDFTPAEVTIIYTDGRKEIVTAYTQGGSAQLDVNSILSDTPPKAFVIRVLGLTKRINP